VQQRLGLVIGKLSERSQKDSFLRTSIEELNRDLQRTLEPLERAALDCAPRNAARDSGSGQESAANRAIRPRTQGQRVSGDDSSEILRRTLQDFRTAFATFNPAEPSEALQCVLKGVMVHPGKLALEIFELEEFCPTSQSRKEWLPDMYGLRTLRFEFSIHSRKRRS
jgi:hypothetical protein